MAFRSASTADKSRRNCLASDENLTTKTSKTSKKSLLKSSHCTKVALPQPQGRKPSMDSELRELLEDFKVFVVPFLIRLNRYSPSDCDSQFFERLVSEHRPPDGALRLRTRCPPV
jgi:hypothetical protein